MKVIIWFNFCINIALVAYVVYKVNRISISIERTFWCKKPMYIMCWWHSRPICEDGGNSAKGFLTIPLCNQEKAEKWDSEMFESGEYKTYKS